MKQLMTEASQNPRRQSPYVVDVDKRRRTNELELEDIPTAQLTGVDVHLSE